MHAIVQVRQFLLEVFSIGLPRHAIDTRCRVPLKREVALLQEIDGDVMQQCGEPHTLALSRRSAHGDKPVRRDRKQAEGAVRYRESLRAPFLTVFRPNRLRPIPAKS